MSPPHRCPTPQPGPDLRDPSGTGTVWQCPVCGRFHVCKFWAPVGPYWEPVRWYHLAARRRIKETT